MAAAAAKNSPPQEHASAEPWAAMAHQLDYLRQTIDATRAILLHRRQSRKNNEHAARVDSFLRGDRHLHEVGT